MTSKNWLGGIRRLLSSAAAFVAMAVAATALSSAQAIEFDQEKLKRAQAIGKLTWYGSIYPETLRDRLVKEFEELTGLDVNIYVGGTGQIVSRLETERKAGSYNVDVFDGADLEVIDNALIKTGLMRPYTPSSAANIAEKFKHPDGYWHGMYFWTLLLEYNTNIYDEGSAPKTFDLLNLPEYKGQVVVSDPARSAAGLGFIKTMVHWKGWDWVEKLAQNDPLVVAIGPGVEQAVVKGERPIGTVVSAFTSSTLKQGGPVAIANPQHLFSSPEVVGVMKDAPNPDGAELLVEYLTSREVHEMFRESGWFPCRVDVDGPHGMPSADALDLKFVSAPSIGMSREDIAGRFHKMLQAAN